MPARLSLSLLLVLALSALAAPASALPPIDEMGPGPGGDPGAEPGNGPPAPQPVPADLPITLLPEPRGLEPGLPGPYGLYRANCANDFCMPDLPIPEPFCQRPETGDNMIRDGRNYGNIRDACYQLVLALAFQPAPLYFVLQQFERNIHRSCNEQFPAWSLNKYRCYGAAPVAAEEAAPLARQVYGRIPLPSFNLPSIGNVPPFPHPTPIRNTHANQPSHARLATCGPGGSAPCQGVGNGRQIAAGTTLYLTGVVHPVSKMLFRFKDPSSGEVLGWFITDEAHENGVMHHERQAFNTGSLRAGPVVVEASYLRWEDNQPVTQDLLTMEIVAPG